MFGRDEGQIRELYGQDLREARETLGWSPAQLARAYHLTPEWVSLLEAGGLASEYPLNLLSFLAAEVRSLGLAQLLIHRAEGPGDDRSAHLRETISRAVAVLAEAEAGSMADKRGKQPSRNTPSKGTPADKRKKNPDGTRRGAKPGPKPKR